MNSERVTVSSVINDALTIVSKYPVILLVFLLPALITLVGGVAIAGGAGALGNFEDFAVQNGEFDVGFAAGIAGAAILISILVGIVSVLVSGIAIAMTSNAWENKNVDLSIAFDKMKDKWLILIVAAIILGILQAIGVLACCVGWVIVVVLTAFVRQGIVLDDLGLTESFSASFNLAKKVWVDLLVIFIINLIVALIIGLIPVIGSFLGELVNGFFIVAITIYYIGITRTPPSEPIPEE